MLWAWNGFWRLSNTRPQGFAGPLRIPMSEIEAYTRLQRFSLPKTLDFLFFVERLDGTYMEYVIEKQEQEKTGGAKPPPRPPKTRR